MTAEAKDCNKREMMAHSVTLSLPCREGDVAAVRSRAGGTIQLRIRAIARCRMTVRTMTSRLSTSYRFKVRRKCSECSA